MICTKCTLDKDVSHFVWLKRKQQYHSWCHECQATNARERRARKFASGKYCSCGRKFTDNKNCDWCATAASRSTLEQKRARSLKWKKKQTAAMIRSRGDKRKLKVIMAYGGLKCQCPHGCDITALEFLTIDHIKGGGCKHRKEIKANILSWLIKNNFPPGFRILCMNCNMSLGRRGYCPHERKAATGAALALAVNHQ